VLFANLLADLNFANVFKNKKRLESKKTLENVKKRDQNFKKRKKKLFYIYGLEDEERG